MKKNENSSSNYSKLITDNRIFVSDILAKLAVYTGEGWIKNKLSVDDRYLNEKARMRGLTSIKSQFELSLCVRTYLDNLPLANFNFVVRCNNQR